MNQGTPITLTDEQRVELERRVRSQTLDARSVRRARIVLLAADGVGNHEIARRLEISRGQVIAWRNRFAEGGVAAIESDLPRSGRKPTIDAAEIVRLTTQTTPEGATHWSTRWFCVATRKAKCKRWIVRSPDCRSRRGAHRP